MKSIEGRDAFVRLPLTRKYAKRETQIATDWPRYKILINNVVILMLTWHFVFLECYLFQSWREKNIGECCRFQFNSRISKTYIPYRRRPYQKRPFHIRDVHSMSDHFKTFLFQSNCIRIQKEFLKVGVRDKLFFTSVATMNKKVQLEIDSSNSPPFCWLVKNESGWLQTTRA